MIIPVKIRFIFKLIWINFRLNLLKRNGRFPKYLLHISCVSDGGHGGFFIYQLGRKMTVLIGNGSAIWLAEKNMPATVQAGQWFNLAFRWRSDKGIQV